MTAAFVRYLTAFCLVLIGLFCLAVSVANLYNIDGYRPFVLVIYAIAGLVALILAHRLAKRSQAPRDASTPPTA